MAVLKNSIGFLANKKDTQCTKCNKFSALHIATIYKKCDTTSVLSVLQASSVNPPSPNSAEGKNWSERPVFERTGNDPITPARGNSSVSFMNLLNELNDNTNEQLPE